MKSRVGHRLRRAERLSACLPIALGWLPIATVAAATSVSLSTVFAGAEFTITATGLHPSLLGSVLIDGEPLDPTRFTTARDTEITVVAPDTFGLAPPVVVQTTHGLCDDNVTVAIIGLAAAAARTAPGIAPTPAAAAVIDPDG